MAFTFWLTILDPTNGTPKTGLTPKVQFGDVPMNGRSAGAWANGTELASTMTESPSNSGAYKISLPETNQYTILGSGAADDEYANVFLVGDDIATTTLLGSDGSGAVAAGATRVKANANSGMFPASPTVQTCLQDLAGSGRATGGNQNIKYCYDQVVAINTWRGAVSQAQLAVLASLTATAADLNKVAGFSSYANITAANVGALVGGGSTSLHTHPISVFTGDLNIGQVTIDGEDILTTYFSGNFTTGLQGTHFLNSLDPADAGHLVRSLVELDSRIYQLWIGEGGGVGTSDTWIRIFNSASLNATGAVSADLAMVDWTRSASSYKICARFSALSSNRTLYNVRLWVYAYMAGAVGQKGHVRFSKLGGTGGEVAEVTITSDGTTNYAWYSVSIVLGQSLSGPDSFTVELMGDGTNNIHLSGHLVAEAS